VGGTLKIWNPGVLTIDGGAVVTESFDHTSGGTFNFRDGSLTVDGGTFDQGVAVLVVDGAGDGDLSTLNLINGAATTDVQNALIGSSNQAALSISTGGHVSSLDGVLGFGGNSSGTATVNGAGSTWDNSGGLSVGLSGTGTLSILDGGTVTNVDGFLGLLAGWFAAGLSLPDEAQVFLTCHSQKILSTAVPGNQTGQNQSLGGAGCANVDGRSHGANQAKRRAPEYRTATPPH
ncbi:MAG: hypothetical protein QF384_21545, partial [Alphaproteobacteria bacterium]|nr:hypothetical protein [Alphaproteobacteria bacterium]